MPVAAIKLELICDDFFDKRNHQLENFDWRLRYMRKLGSDKSPSQIIDYRTGRVQKHIRDYTYANSTGSRGIFAHYFLADGIYRIIDRYKINQVRRYIIQVKNGKINEISKQDADQWLKDNSV